MKMRLYLVTALIALLFTGCGNPGGKIKPVPMEKKIVLGFSQLGAESDWRTANTDSIISAAAQAGIELKFSNALQLQDNQIKAMRSFIAQGIDVIAFSPVIESGWDSVLQEAKNAGIPVIITDRWINTRDDSLYVTYMGSDFAEEGRKAGNWLIDKLKDQKREINIVELAGNPKAAPTIGRGKGFREVLAGHPDFRIIKSAVGDFMRSKGKETMEEFLKDKSSKIDVLFAQNDDMALGAVEAIKEAGIKPGKDILIVSVDGTRAAFQAMIQGDINCSVECNPLLGPQLMDAVKSIMEGKTLPKRIITKEGIFPQELAAADLPKRKY